MKDFMEKIATGIGAAVVDLIYLAVFVAIPFGIWHAFEGHGVRDGLISVFVPSYA